MTHFITKAPPIININSKCHIKKLKSSRTCLIGYLDFISREWFLIAWGADTRRHTCIPTSQKKTISRNQTYVGLSVSGLKTYLFTLILQTQSNITATYCIVQYFDRGNIDEFETNICLQVNFKGSYIFTYIQWDMVCSHDYHSRHTRSTNLKVIIHPILYGCDVMRWRLQTIHVIIYHLNSPLCYPVCCNDDV